MAPSPLLPAPVLYVEDDADDIFFMRHAWKLAGMPNPLFVVTNGQQAIDYLDGQGDYVDRQQHPLPALVLLDLKLPVKNGFEVLGWVRSQPAFEALRVVIVSASEQEQDIAQARSLGITDYLVKPSSPLDLVNTILARKTLWLGQGT